MLRSPRSPQPPAPSPQPPVPQQQSLFDTEPAPWEVDDAAQAARGHGRDVRRAGGRIRLPRAGGDDRRCATRATSGTGPPRACAVGPRQSQRRGVLRRARHEADGRAEAQSRSPACSIASRCSRRRCCGSRSGWPTTICARWGQVLEAVVPAGVRHDVGHARRDVPGRRAGCGRADCAS